MLVRICTIIGALVLLRFAIEVIEALLPIFLILAVCFCGLILVGGAAYWLCHL